MEAEVEVAVTLMEGYASHSPRWLIFVTVWQKWLLSFVM